MDCESLNKIAMLDVEKSSLEFRRKRVSCFWMRKCEICVWATYVSTSKLGIPGLVSYCDTILLALQAWKVSLAYLV